MRPAKTYRGPARGLPPRNRAGWGETAGGMRPLFQKEDAA